MSFHNKPQRLWWRRAVFQVHLWTGVVLCLYMVVIGVTGSILVFESQIEHLVYSHLWRVSDSAANVGARSVDLPYAVDVVRKAYPGFQPTVAYIPDRLGDNFEVFIHRDKEIRYVFIDANSGKIAGDIDPDHSWLVWIIDLHFRLLGGHTGLVLNGIGAACLLLLCLTGSVVWWRGLRHWTRGLTVDLRRSWRRINFDLHSTVGFWTLLILSMWAFTGVYLVWPKPIESFVNQFSSVASANPPKLVIPSRSDANPMSNVRAMIRRAEQSSPKAKFAGAFFPVNNKAPLTLLMAHGALRNFTKMDYVYFDPATGRELGVWHRGVNPTWGSKFIFWLSPLHFGYYWGMGIMILWAALGCALPLLAITGLLMYWNRSLSRKWRSIR